MPFEKPSSISSRKPSSACPPVLRREQLRNGFRAAVDALDRCRADGVPDGFIADYIALRWLHWHAGALHVTAAGHEVRSQVLLRGALPA